MLNVAKDVDKMFRRKRRLGRESWRGTGLWKERKSFGKTLA